MTRKDYERAAAMVRDLMIGVTTLPKGNITIKGNVTTVRDRIVGVHAAQEAFILFFTRDNPRFDADKFRKACELS